MEKLIYFLILILPLGQLGRLVTNWPDLRLQFNDLAVFLVALVFLKRVSIREVMDKFKKWRYLIFFILIAFMSWVSNLGSYDLRYSVVGGLYLLRFALYWFLFFLITSYLAKRACGKKIVLMILNLLVLAGFVIALIGIGQFFVFSDLSILSGGEWDPHVNRLVGSFFDPGYTGALLILSLVILIYDYYSPTLFNRSHIWKQILRYFVILVNFQAMILTYSRSVYFMYFLAVFLISYFKRSVRFLVGAVLVFIILVNLIPRNTSYGTKLDRSETLFSRIEDWKFALNTFAKKPILGVGFNNLRYERVDMQKNENTDVVIRSNAAAGIANSYLFVLATTGIIGLLLFFLFLVDLIRRLFIKSKSVFGRWISEIVIISFAAILGQSIFLNSFFYPNILEWLILLLIVREGVEVDSRES